MGVGRGELRRTMAEVLLALGTRHAVVVTGDDGLGEISLAATTQVTEVYDGELTEFSWRAEDFGLPAASTDSMIVAGPEESAVKVRDVLAGKRGPARDIVLMNAAAALWIADFHPSLAACAARAAEAIDSGAARELLTRLAAMSAA
jgi:anthranilate phosphoribosyltransferase